jgi:hypothetical protein
MPRSRTGCFTRSRLRIRQAVTSPAPAIARKLPPALRGNSRLR